MCVKFQLKDLYFVIDKKKHFVKYLCDFILADNVNKT